MRHALAFVAFGLSIGIARPALAQGASDKAAAEALFNEARKLSAQGSLQAACGKFEASEKLDPAPGTLLNVANCSEQLGKTASAWVQFREAAAMARAAGDAKRERIALDRSIALEPRLVRLKIQVSPAAASASGLEITRDQTTIEAGMWGSAMPIDPGVHTLQATATGRQRWSTSIEVKATDKEVQVDVPALAPEAAALKVEPAAPPADVTPVANRKQRTWALVTGATGIAAIGLGAAMAVSATTNWSNAKKHCAFGESGCDAEGVQLSKDAVAAGRISTIAVSVGMVALATGTVLWLTAPSQPAVGRGVYVAPVASETGPMVLVGGRL